ncbi:hypothetical protein B0A48_04362 [Cryoendolithus antarcticus]|uniref:Geranylgeranyl pyrophosphate synthase n=1 Tax=Cryoendolithus antarcticus TaxID=1507870 RepID=A0A1V8TF46_9PEZI|nr:hypothetical protein B0A48_04362 [Cryoendolithus antarcticus]
MAAIAELPASPERKVARPISIDPASIPTRTSSSKAFTNGDSPRSPTSPRKRNSHMTLPTDPQRRSEVPETDWIAPSKTPRASHSSPQHKAHRKSMSQSQSIPDASQAIGQDLIHGHGSSWSTEKENIVKGPFDYLESHPGKDVRTQLINAFNLWLQVPQHDLAIINSVVGMLHSASLLIDDVEDNSNLRRGVPVAHQIFGVAQTINSANYVYFRALQELLLLNNPEAIQIYTTELLNLHRGQGMDLFWRDTLTCPSEDDYLEMVGNKTGGLFRLAIKLMCACSPAQRNPSTSADYTPLVNTIGLLFQILDDYRNLSSAQYTANKGLCEDLTEGKFSFPILHAIRAAPQNLVLINILKQKPTDEDVKRYAVAYMESVGSFAYTRRVLRGLQKKAAGLVEAVDNGRGLGRGVSGILDALKVDEREGKGKGKESALA